MHTTDTKMFREPIRSMLQGEKHALQTHVLGKIPAHEKVLKNHEYNLAHPYSQPTPLKVNSSTPENASKGTLSPANGTLQNSDTL